jgi:hypothetical protein
MVLLHRDENAPMVLVVGGYWIESEDHVYEPTKLLQANQLIVEHRFFGESRPAPADWKTLDIRQAASDHNRIVTALNSVYQGKWISTGLSKGGMGAIFHRRFFPGDVDGTVAYSSPISYGTQDPRYAAFVAQAGTKGQCNDRLIKFQRSLLRERESMVRCMMSYATENGDTLNILGPDRAFEFAVLEFSFGFWMRTEQAQEDCEVFPDPSDDPKQAFRALAFHGNPTYFMDRLVNSYAGLHYQRATQLGTSAFLERPLSDQDLLRYPGEDVPRTFLPASIHTTFDPSAMQDIQNWVKRQGYELMLVYGSADPWSVGAIELGSATDRDSYRYTFEGGNHYSQISDLPEAERTAAIGTLCRWAGLSDNCPGLLAQ